MQMRDCIYEFKIDCELRRLTPRTIKGYVNNNLQFAEYLKNEHQIEDIVEIKPAHIILEGFSKRSEYISKLMGIDMSSIGINFNYNRPIDNSSLITDIQKQIEMGVMSTETAMRISPYIIDVEEEKKLIGKNVQDIVVND